MKLKTLLLVAMTATAGFSAHAMLPTPEQTSLQAEPSKIDSKVHAFFVRSNDTGGESLVPITASDRVVAGDIIEYQGLFTNQDTNRVRSMTVTLNVPAGTELVGGISPNTLKASADGSRFGFMPLRANINGQIQELPLHYYKTLRWSVEDVGIGATAVVKYRVKVK